MIDVENEASVKKTPHRRWFKWAPTTGGGAAGDQPKPDFEFDFQLELDKRDGTGNDDFFFIVFG